MVLQKMRAGAQGLLAKALVGVIVFVLAVTGFGAIQLFSASEPVAATVDGEDITERELDREIDQLRAQVRSQLGDEPSPELIEQFANRQSALEGLIVRALLDHAVDALRLGLSDADVEARIRREFAGVDDFTFRQHLANQGFTPASFQTEFAKASLREQLRAGFRDTAFVTDRETRHAARLQFQQRDVAWLLFDVAAVAEDATVTDADVEEHYGAFLEDYMTEERFDFDIVRLPKSRFADAAEVDEEAIAQAYEDEILGLEPQRHAAHILLETSDERTAEEATRLLRETRAEVEAGADFAAKARELSEDAGSAGEGGDLGPAGRGVFVPAFEEALWALEPGELSEPVETEFGVHLIHLIAIREPDVPPLAERRDAIAATLREQEAQRLFDEALDEMKEIAFEQADSLAALTAAFDLTAEPLDGATRASRDGLLADYALREALFGDDVLLEGYNSDAVALDGAEAIVGRLRARHPPTERPLAEASAEIRDVLARAQALGIVEEAAFATLTSLAGGATPAAAEDETGLEWQRADGLRLGASDVPPAIVRQAFEMPAPGEGERGVEVATLADGSRAVVMLSNVELADYAALPEAQQTAMAESLQRLEADRDYLAVLATLRAEASIDAIAFESDS